MDATAWNGHGVRAARLLALFAVLLGLLAMHGLASSHHSPAAADEYPAVTASPHDRTGAEPHDQAAAAVLALHHPTGPPAGPDGPSCHDCPGVLVTLCVAVLAAAATLAAGVVLHRRRRPVASRALGAVLAPASARAALPPPDTVRELCVSRT